MPLAQMRRAIFFRHGSRAPLYDVALSTLIEHLRYVRPEPVSLQGPTPVLANTPASVAVPDQRRSSCQRPFRTQKRQSIPMSGKMPICSFSSTVFDRRFQL